MKSVRKHPKPKNSFKEITIFSILKSNADVPHVTNPCLNSYDKNMEKNSHKNKVFAAEGHVWVDTEHLVLAKVLKELLIQIQKDLCVRFLHDKVKQLSNVNPSKMHHN